MPARSVCLVALSLSEAGPGRFGRQVSVTDIYHTIPWVCYRRRIPCHVATTSAGASVSACQPLLDGPIISLRDMVTRCRLLAATPKLTVCSFIASCLLAKTWRKEEFW